MGTGILLIFGMVIESKKAVEEVDDSTAYKGSSFGIVVSIGIMALQLRNLPSCPEVLRHFLTCHCGSHKCEGGMGGRFVVYRDHQTGIREVPLSCAI